MRWFLRLVFLALLGYGGWYGWNWYQGQKVPAESTYRYSTVKRGDLLVAIGSTGTVEPEEVVDVGSQVAGKILSFGKDTEGKEIDYGSHVTANSMLAEIDDSVYQADLNSAKAQLDQAKAGVTRSKADLEQSKARLVQAEADWKRAQELVADSLTQAEYDTAKANYEIAKANVDVSEAAIVQANSSVKQAEAGIFRAERNLGFCEIKSPVDGVIIDRRVNIGQTVVASLNAASLFLIAKDLRRMEVWVAVNEADIGAIHVGQNVTFTCDSFAGVTFKGQVSKRRLNATMTQNVVTYTVEVTTENPDEKLLPYLTANVSFEVDKRENVVLVPNTALRFTPSSVLAAQASTPMGGGANAASGAGAMADKPTGTATPDKPKEVAESDKPSTANAPEQSGDAVAAARPDDPKSAPEGSPDPSAQSGGGPGREGGSGRHRGNGNGGNGADSGGSTAEGGSGRRWSRGGGGNRSGGGPSGKMIGRGQTSGEGTVWVMKAGQLQSIKVKTGLTDDQMTEILGDSLPEGTEVIVGEIVADDPNATAGQATNPFAPPMMGMGRGRSGGGMGGSGMGGSGTSGSRRGP